MNDWWWRKDDVDYSGIQWAQGMLKDVFKVCCEDKSEESLGKWSMHSDDWTHTYPPEAAADVTIPAACVEVRVHLDADGATTRWIWDSDNYVTSHEYGEEIPYPDEPDEADAPREWLAWLKTLKAQIAKAAEAAWNADALSCDECGYHYHAGHEPCCEPEEAA